MKDRVCPLGAEVVRKTRSLPNKLTIHFLRLVFTVFKGHADCELTQIIFGIVLHHSFESHVWPIASILQMHTAEGQLLNTYSTLRPRFPNSLPFTSLT